MKRILQWRFYVPAAIIVIIASFLLIGGSGNGDYSFAEAKISSLESVVSVTGNVKPSASVDLAFEVPGRVRNVYATVGSSVIAGSRLVALDSSEIYAKYNEAVATVKAEQAKLDELRRGSIPEEIRVEEVKLSNAKRSLENEKMATINILQEVYTNTEDVVHNTIDQFFSNPRTPSLVFLYSSDSRLRSSIESERLSTELVLNQWALSLNMLTKETLDDHMASSTKNLSVVKSLLDKVAGAVNSMTSSATLTQATIDAYKAAVSNARTTINTNISAINDAREAIDSAEAAIALSESELAFKKTPTRPEQIQAQVAAFERAIANQQTIESHIAKTILLSPIDGIITKVEIEEGEIVSANQSVVSIISQGSFEIEAYIPEADIGEVSVGNSAKVRLDSYPEKNYTARVIAVYPAETIREGVSTYKVLLAFDTVDTRVRSGMTANLDIVTRSVRDVLTIPNRAVYQKIGTKTALDGEAEEEKRFVKVLEGDVVSEKSVVTGLRGSNGQIEVISGLSLGEKVIISEHK